MQSRRRLRRGMPRETRRSGRSQVSSYEHRRAVRILSGVFAVAVVVSIAHYTDNYVNYHDYPQSRTLPNPSAALVLGAWFGFTAAGLAGYLLFRRRPSDLALVLLAAYSGSGLVASGTTSSRGRPPCRGGASCTCAWTSRAASRSSRLPFGPHEPLAATMFP